MTQGVISARICQSPLVCQESKCPKSFELGKITTKGKNLNFSRKFTLTSYAIDTEFEATSFNGRTKIESLIDSNLYIRKEDVFKIQVGNDSLDIHMRYLLSDSTNLIKVKKMVNSEGYSERINDYAITDKEILTASCK